MSAGWALPVCCQALAFSVILPEQETMSSKSFMRRSANRLLQMIARPAPGATGLRPYLHRLRGVRIKGAIFIGDDVYIENEYPERIEINDGAGIAIRSTILCHFRGPGKIIIGRNVWIGACCTITARKNQILTIGEGAVVAAGSTVISDVSPFTFVGGVPAKPIARATVPATLGFSYYDFKNGLRPLK